MDCKKLSRQVAKLAKNKPLRSLRLCEVKKVARQVAKLAKKKTFAFFAPLREKKSCTPSRQVRQE